MNNTIDDTQLPITIGIEKRKALPTFIVQLPQKVQDEIKEIAQKLFAEYNDESIIPNIMDSKIIDVLAIFEDEVEQYDKVLLNEIVTLIKKEKQIPFTYEVQTFETSEGATGEFLPKMKIYNITPFLDEVEDECWNLFKSYAGCAGIVFDEDSEIDFRVAKELSEQFIAMVENTFGRKFPLNVETQSQEDEDMDYDR